MRTEDCVTRDELVSSFRRALDDDQHTLLRRLREDNTVADFAQSVADGLSERPRRLDCRFLYDAEGSAIYEQICQQPEYYPTRTEAGILAAHSDRLAQLTGNLTLVELGSGNSEKTNHILQAYDVSASDRIPYVPVDVSESALRKAARNIAARFRATQVVAVNSSYEDAFPLLQVAGPTMVFFLGSTIGNFDDEESDEFWTKISTHQEGGSYFLLGIDLVKSPDLLEAAYNDRAGVTAAFTRNLFARMNRDLGSQLDLNSIEHEAHYNEELEQIEIHARFEESQRIDVEPLGLSFEVDRGERILTEVSRKFRIEKMARRLRRFGLEVREVFTDDNDWFALLLLESRPPAQTGKP